MLRRNNPGTPLVLKEHDGGVKSIAWDPKGELLASAGGRKPDYISRYRRP